MLTGVLGFRLPRADNSSDMFRGISDAFDAALHRAVIPTTLAVLVTVVLASAATFALVRWLRREDALARADRLAREEQRRRIASTTPPERRAYVRVPAHVPLTIPKSEVHHGRCERHETEDLSGGGLSFSSQAPPRVGAKLELVLDLGDDQELSMHGEVVRITPSRLPRAPSLVGVAFRDLATSTREQLLRWIAAEEIREIGVLRRGTLCALCGLPLAEADASTHPSCASAARTIPPGRASGVPRSSAAPPISLLRRSR